ncbi:hypothetical protein AALB16_13090 [Lachnospiraceae bacterium 62-35]
MPYCPKCDMEFVDGITVCTDCGGPLMPSKEAADALKREELEMEQAQRFAAMREAGITPEMLTSAERGRKVREAGRQPNVYVNTAEKYKNMKSSAAAFYGVSFILIAASILAWSGIIPVPIAGFSRILTLGVFTAMGICSLLVAVSSSKTAKELSSQVQKEETRTADILNEFLKSYTADSLDQILGEELNGLTPEEITLKRLELIQDILVTTQDISDQTYADSLADELYGEIFDD